MSTTQRVNAAEKDLEKFIKFLTLKSVQVIVQSRLGEKFQTQCNPLATGNDWFNIVINDHPDVAAETKHALAMKAGDSILQRLPLSVEISLKTVDGDQMVLEVWSIDLQPLINGTANNRDRDTVDAAKGVANEQQLIKASHAIYNRMGILLKSLITLTRTTPAYKLSRRQCPDSYDIYYRIYVDRPQTHSLGEGYKQVRIGQLNTIVGTLSMSVAYRTKMTFTPTAAHNRNAETNAIMLKSDHFRPNTDNSGGAAATAATAQNNKSILAAGQKKGIGVCVPTEHRVIDLNKPMRPGAFADPNKMRQYTDDDFILPEVPPFEWLLRRVGTDCSTGSIESLNCKCINEPTTNTPTTTTTPLGNGYQQHINISNNNNINNNNNNNNIHVFNQNLQNNNNNNNNKQENYSSGGGEGGDLITMINTAGQQQLSTTEAPIKSLMVSVPPLSNTIAMPVPVSPQCDDDNLLKELNFPFATSTSHVDDLAKFYRDCYHAPPLRGLSEIASDYETTNNCSNNINTNNINNSSSSSNNNSIVSCSASAFAIAADSAAVDDLSRQLEQFETSLEDYDKLVSQFGLSGSSSTGSRSSGGLQMSN